jgi:hypothetical protein
MVGALSGIVLAGGGLQGKGYAQAQEAAETVAAASPEAAAPEPLSAEELEVLVARIALYPDELVAVIVSSSLYPLQVVQAARYLDKVKTKPDLKPDESWDGSVVSLMNYPEIVTMMSDDLEWTEALGEAITNQQKDVLAAIQQLRDKAVAMGVLKSDEKTKVVVEEDSIVIQPANAETVYVPQYAPEMLYEPEYVPAPITYYPEPYPSYYYPTAPYFAAFVTGAVWGAVVDWNDWGVWGGNGNWGNDINIGCNNCFNNINGNIDWKNVDRNNLKFDKAQFNNLDRSKFKDGLKANDRNNFKNKAADRNRNRASTLPARGKQAKDVRKSTLDGLKAKPGNKMAKPGQGAANRKPGQGVASGDKGRPGGNKASRPSGKAKPAARADNRPRNPSPMGDMNRGRDAKSHSNRGGRSMGGGASRGSSMQRRPIPRGGGGGGRGGGGRGGGGRR